MKKSYAQRLVIALICFFSQLTASQTTTWTGILWDNGTPDITKEAIISSGTCVLSIDTSVKSITVLNGANLTVASNITLTVDNTLTVDGGGNLIFENGASLIQINATAVNTGAITYKRDAKPMRQYEFTYWGSPVYNQVLNVFSPLTLGDKFYSFNASAGVNNWVVENQANFMISGKGYAIRAPQGYTTTPQVFNGDFIGVPNNGTILTSVAAFNPAIKNYNLLSNPYPSAINVVTLIDNTNLGTLYFWTHNSAISSNVFTTDDYAIRTKTTGTAAVTGGFAPSVYIAAGQGFFASAGTNATINFTNIMRVSSNNEQFYRSAQNLPLNYYVHLNMTNTIGAFKQIAIGYQEDATNDYDFGSDALASSEGAIQFYSLIPTLSFGFGIQARAYPWVIGDVIPLGYSTTQAGTFSFEIDHFDTFFADKEIFLEDTSNQTFHNLRNSSFTFTTTVGAFDSRFKIHYQDLSLSNNNFTSNNDLVYVLNQNNQPKVIATNATIKKIIVFDMLGRTVFEKQNINESEFVLFELNSKNQPLIIKTILDNNVTVAKKFVF